MSPAQLAQLSDDQLRTHLFSQLDELAKLREIAERISQLEQTLHEINRREI